MGNPAEESKHGDHGSHDDHGHGGHGHDAPADMIPEGSPQDFFLNFLAGCALIGLCLFMFIAIQGTKVEEGHHSGTAEHAQPATGEQHNETPTGEEHSETPTGEQH